MKLFDKLTELLDSPRFWYNLLIGLMVGLQQNDWKIGVITALGLITGTATADRTADKIATIK